MNWVADENVDRAIVEWLRDQGHSVWYVCEMQPGTRDDDVLGLAARESAILITSDKDYGDSVFRQGRASAGVMLLRLAGLSSQEKSKIVGSVVANRLSELRGAFVVVSRDSVRIRRPLS